MITAMDWYPTVLKLCGIERSGSAPPLDGHSLLPVIESATAPSDYGGVLHFQWGKKWAVRQDEWKLVGVDGKPKMTLHRLTGAEPERIDYAQERPELVKHLKTLHDQWARDVAPD